MKYEGQIRVLLLIRSSLFRRGVERVLSCEEDFEIFEATEVNEIYSMVENPLPDVAIIDIDFSVEGGLASARRLKLRLPDIGIIILTSHYTNVHLFQFLEAQAAACLTKEASEDQLVDTVRRVAHGERPINENIVTNPILAAHVFRKFQELYQHTESYLLVSRLTHREIEILNYIDQGLMNKQIANELGISEQTIKNHVSSILRKLNANARNQAVDVARKQGLISVR